MFIHLFSFMSFCKYTKFSFSVYTAESNTILLTAHKSLATVVIN